MTLQIHELSDGQFAIDDGNGLRLSLCPCCDKPFNRQAAETVVRNVTDGKATFAALCDPIWDIVRA